MLCILDIFDGVVRSLKMNKYPSTKVYYTYLILYKKNPTGYAEMYDCRTG